MTAVKQLEAEQAVARAVLGDRPERPNGYVLPVVFTLGVALCCLFGEKAIDQPLRWKKPRRIFVNSMSDLFHESLPDEWIDRIVAVMSRCPQHQFQVLTKRSARMRDYLEGDALNRIIARLVDETGEARL